jgi:hypothetical protein
MAMPLIDSYQLRMEAIRYAMHPPRVLAFSAKSRAAAWCDGDIAPASKLPVDKPPRQDYGL